MDPLVAPWDRRVRVFVSSTLEELAPERAAVRAAVERLRLTPVMFELGARAHPPRELYASYLRQSDVFVGVYGERYGWVAPGSAISGLEDEYDLAADHPKLLYVKTPAPGREPRLTALIERIWTTSGVSTAPYSDPAQLGERVADDLAVLLTERFARPRQEQPALDPVPLPHPATALIGRDGVHDDLVRLLRDEGARLVTLTGPGGIGKTRLALAVADALAPHLEAVAFVDLSAVDRPDGVLPAVAAALGVRPAPRPAAELLADVVGDHRVLVVLDNMEHLVAAGPAVAGLIGACPGLRVLVTSRVVLRLRDEHQVPLRPLAVPGDRSTSEDVAAAPAARLFVHRARQVRPGFAVTDGNAAELSALLHRLEGIPLALEIAASRLGILPLGALLRGAGAELDLASRDVDVPDRQRTLRATIAWSYGLLGAEEAALARCLAVIPGGWTLAAAEAVGGPGAVDGLAVLVEHSLVSADLEAAGEPRFRMLDSVRTFLAEELDRDAGRPAAMRRLAAHLLALAREAEAGLRSGASRTWRTRVDAEREALRAVLGWAVESDDASLAVRLTTPLTWYWWSRGLLVEMLRRAEEVAALPSAAALEPSEAAVLSWCRGTMRIVTGEVDLARPLLDRAVRDARARGDDAVLALALFGSALATAEDAAPQAAALLEESVGLFRRRGDHWGLALALTPLGGLALLLGEHARAESVHSEALAAAEVIDDDHMRAVVLDQLAADALVRGDTAAAAGLLCRSAAVHLEVHDDEGVANCLDGFAALALVLGDPDAALRWLTAAERVRATAGVTVWPFLRPLRDQLADAVRAAGGTEPDPAGPWDGLAELARARTEALRLVDR